jgi:hypothetical protein
MLQSNSPEAERLERMIHAPSHGNGPEILNKNSDNKENQGR